MLSPPNCLLLILLPRRRRPWRRPRRNCGQATRKKLVVEKKVADLCSFCTMAGRGQERGKLKNRLSIFYRCAWLKKRWADSPPMVNCPLCFCTVDERISWQRQALIFAKMPSLSPMLVFVAAGFTCVLSPPSNCQNNRGGAACTSCFGGLGFILRVAFCVYVKWLV